MLTKLTIRNYKRFGEVVIDLGSPVIFVGPNNSGKTSALEALALWQVGLKRWREKREGKKPPEKRPGVTINRKDLVAGPVPVAHLLWRNTDVRDSKIIAGKQSTKNIIITVIVEGIINGKLWKCGLEFDYANEESFYCRPLRLSEGKNPERMNIPEEASLVEVGFLPPLSGLAANETHLDDGAINVRIGEGRTAEVLRNLCYKVNSENPSRWHDLKSHIGRLFGIELEPPTYIKERGEIIMGYQEHGTKLDLSSSGRGVQQILLLFAYMYTRRGSVLLLDEPDAHLEILRQRQTYQLLTDVAAENDNQIIAASHSEVILNEAAERDVVIAFIGKPHRINDKGTQVLKALKSIGFEDYYLAEQTGWILYLEGSTDLAILRSFAKILGYERAAETLAKPFVKYVANQPSEVKKHFHGIREAVPDIQGVALFDRIDEGSLENLGARGLIWRKREIENYLCFPETFESFAIAAASPDALGPLFAAAEREKRLSIMRECIDKIAESMENLGKGSPWDADAKVSDEFLTPLFKMYFERLQLPNMMEKKNFHELAALVPHDKLDSEIKEKLDIIVEIALSAKSG